MLKIEELVHNYINKNCDFDKEIVLTNFFHSDWEADILSIDNSGFSHEIEIKLSKSDFKNDFKKFYTNQKSGEKFLKHDKIGCGDYICNAFSFLLSFTNRTSCLSSFPILMNLTQFSLV